VLDEVQLMGVGSSTTAQLQGLRDQLGTAAPTRSLWMSATLPPGRLRTIDHQRALAELALTAADLARPALAARYRAPKPIAPATSARAEDRAAEILAAHVPGTLTLVVVNQVRRAQDLYAALDARGAAGAPLALVHSRFRPADRAAIQARALAPGFHGILVATQAIEAGVDLSARTLFTELAAWPALVQRFGRCNRRGEHARAEARVRWLDVADADAAPYTPEQLAVARGRLAALTDASPAALAEIPLDPEPPVLPVLRRRDLLDLFDTQPDLSGADLDVSRWIRDGEERDVQVAWRELDGPPPADAPDLHRDELCTVPIAELRRLLEGGAPAFRWSGVLDAWEAVDARRLAPGLALMLSAAAGGYDAALGWTGRPAHRPAPTAAPAEAPDSDEREALTLGCRDYVPLAVHAQDVAEEAAALRAALGDVAPWPQLEHAARWHDLGKAHAVFQELITAALPAGEARRAAGPWAKSAGAAAHARFQRPAFRHELASALALLQLGAPDLVAYLAAAHHGKVRLSVRPRPTERVPDDGRRYALGVWDGDELPATDLGGGVTAPAVRLDLAVTALGDSPAGPSWLDRTARLVREHGPFRLAYWESLVRIADWRGTERWQGPAATEGAP
jgi:CRISPR-associated endonuclease/helicase Cas3